MQVNAIALLAIFLSAGTSLPTLDALVYHHQAAEVGKWHSHLEPAGGCVDHGGHCSLGRTAAGSGAVAALTGEVRDQEPSQASPRILPSQPPASIARVFTPQPRAPPAPRA
jgi:hypothetical protein